MKKVLLTSIFLAMLLEGYGQTPFFQSYFLQKKSEPVNINVIFQDKTGFIWYGTNKGLFKFDGIRYQSFSRADSLPDDNVTAIGEDSMHRIWTGHKNGALAYLENNKIVRFETQEGPAKQQVSKILFDKKGTLWFSTLNDGLYYYNNDRLHRIDEENGMPDLFVYDIAEDKEGKIWAGTDGGVAIIKLVQKTDSRDTISVKILSYRHGMPDNIIKKIVIDKTGLVWMSTDNSGIIYLDPSTGEYKPLLTREWPHGEINDFFIDGRKVWIASAQTGIILYNRRTDESQLYNSKDVPGIMSVNAIIKDSEGNIWAGTRLGVLRTLGDNIEYIPTQWNSADINAEAVAVDSSGSVWWAGKEGLFKRSVSETGEITVEKQLTKTPYEKYAITSLFFDPPGNLWIGFYGEGALRFDPLTGRMKHFRDELRNGNVLNISGKGNTIWLSTLEGATEIVQNGDRTSVVSYSSRDGLSSDYIYQAFTDSRNRVWFATDGKGADMKDNTGFHHFEKGLNSKIVYGFAEDRNHRIWVNVAGDGLYYLDGNEFKPLSPDKGVRDNMISCFSSTIRGNLLVMHDNGIDLYDTRQNKIRYPGDENGMRDKLPNLNATSKGSHGRIYFGTSGGIVIYSSRMDQSNPVPTPLIDEIKVLDKVVEFSPVVDLPYDQNFITLNYLGLWYQSPENLYYQIKLENYDRDWILRRDHSATYSNLPPGNYVFRLRASDTMDFSIAKEVTMNIVIAPPFWRTGWFYLLAAVTTVVVGYLLIQNRERKLLADKKELEAKVQERTVEIQRKTEEIQTQNEEIQSQAEEIKGINENLELLVKERTLELIKKNKALEEYAFITAHNLRAPVASVLGLINLASRLEVDDESKVLIEHLKTSAEKLDTIVRSITVAIEKGE